MQELAKKAIKFLIKEHIKDHAPVFDEDAKFLKECVEKFSVHRHIYLNPDANKKTALEIWKILTKYCDFCFFDGRYSNIVAGWGDGVSRRHIIGGHYDGPPNSPGADDNGSAIASLCLLAKKLSKTKPQDVSLVVFNGEEEGFLGSTEFVELSKPRSAVILEMVGYFTDEENSQQMPEGMPQYSRGDFLAIVGNQHSNSLGKDLVSLGKKVNLPLSLKGLKIPFGLENKLSGLENTCRSDHFPFWEKELPAVMLTDTAEFRNKNYHQPSDTPDTLNYPAMAQVVKLLEEYANKIG